MPGGYQLEARIPASKLGTHLGIVVSNTMSELAAPVRSASFSATTPGRLVTKSVELSDIAAGLAQPGMRLIVTDISGWRIATGGNIVPPQSSTAGAHSAWLRIAYNALGDVIAKVSGRSFEAYMREQILIPSGMPNSSFLLADLPPDSLSVPHLRSYIIYIYLR